LTGVDVIDNMTLDVIDDIGSHTSRRQPMGVMNLLRMAAAGAACLALAPLQAAEPWPTKTVRLVVAQPAGSSADTTARLLAQRLSDAWGQQVVVDNRAGANGIIGMDSVAKSAPDGYTIGFGVPSTMTINQFIYKKMPFNPLEDLMPVTQIGSVPFALLVNPKLPVNNVKELIAYAKSRNGEMNYSSAGIGNIGQLAAELLAMRGGVTMHHIPNKGDSPALLDVIGGQTDMMFAGLPGAVTHVRSGRLRLIAVGGTQRVPSFPDVPTIQESGPAFEDVVIQGWNGLVVPAGTPRDIIVKVQQDAAKALDTPEIRAQFNTGTGLIVRVTTPDEFGAFMKAEAGKWSKLIAKLNLQIEQ
jgi:tripartite-type tricarboxylate transporter receptor subunit TctC